MNRPRHPQGHPDRFLDCEEALEDVFIEMMDMSCEAGWTPAETTAAITSLADHFILKICANDETVRQLVDAKLRRS